MPGRHIKKAWGSVKKVAKRRDVRTAAGAGAIGAVGVGVGHRAGRRKGQREGVGAGYRVGIQRGRREGYSMGMISTATQIARKQRKRRKKRR